MKTNNKFIVKYVTKANNKVVYFKNWGTCDRLKHDDCGMHAECVVRYDAIEKAQEVANVINNMHYAGDAEVIELEESGN